MKTDQLKCLFGHHRYNEVWTIDPYKYTPTLGRKFYVCTICRKSVLWKLYYVKSEELILDTVMNVIDETSGVVMVRRNDNGAAVGTIYLEKRKDNHLVQIQRFGFLVP